MRLTLTALLSGVLVAAAVGCGKNITPSTPSPTQTLTGTWSGDLTVQGTTARMIWTLTQTGNAVAGPVLVVLPTGTVLLNGTLAGTLSGSTLSYTISVAAGGIPLQPSCTGQFGGTTTVSISTVSTLSGNYNLVTSTCPVPLTNGSFTLTKQ